AETVTGSTRIRKVSHLPAVNRESGCPHSAAWQHAVSAGKRTKMSESSSKTTPARNIGSRNGVAKNVSTRPLKSGVHEAIHRIKAPYGSERCNITTAQSPRVRAGSHRLKREVMTREA